MEVNMTLKVINFSLFFFYKLDHDAIFELIYLHLIIPPDLWSLPILSWNYRWLSRLLVSVSGNQAVEAKGSFVISAAAFILTTVLAGSHTVLCQVLLITYFNSNITLLEWGYFQLCGVVVKSQRDDSNQSKDHTALKYETHFPMYQNRGWF